MRYNVVKYQTKLDQNCSFILTEKFFGKSIVTLAQLLRPHQLVTFQKCFRKDHERNVGVIFDPISQKLTISNIFLENIECYFCLLIVPYYATTSQKSA